MALLRRFLSDSYPRHVKPPYTPLKPLAALLQIHGSTPLQGLTPILPWLVNPQESHSRQPGIFHDLLKGSPTFRPFGPPVDIPSERCAEEMLSKLLEQCVVQKKLLEGPELAVLEGLGRNEEGVKIWADSVKKKRRKKMNKHKYKKLRKRLRKKTK